MATVSLSGFEETQSQDRLRVGLVYDDTIDRPGGIGLYVLTLGAALQRRGHYVEYLLGNTNARAVGEAPARSLARNIGVRFNGNSLSMPALSAGRGLDEVLRAGRFDVLHIQVPYSPLMAGRLVTRADRRCAVVGTFHVASDRPSACFGARVLKLLKLRSAGRFDAMMAVSDTAADFARRWSRMPADAVVPNLLDIAACRQLGRLASSGIDDVVFVGRLVPRKGAGQLIAALPEVHRRRGHRRTRVTVIGDGPLRARLEHQARELSVENSVHFAGALDDTAKLRALAGAKIACFPSLYGESFGVVILEALAAGAEAVLAGDNPGYAETLGDPEALVDPRSPEAFGVRLAQLLDDEVARRRLGSAQRQMLPLYDAEVVTEQVLEIYRGAIAGRRGSVRMRPEASAVVRAAA